MISIIAHPGAFARRRLLAAGTIWNALRVALRIFSGIIIYNFAIPENLRIFRNCLFTGGDAAGSGSCRACFLQKQPRGGHPLSLLTAFAASSPKGTPLCYAGNLAATTKSRPLEG